MKLYQKLLSLFGLRKRNWLDDIAPRESFLGRLAKELGLGRLGKFRPHVHYHKDLDWLVIMTADVTAVNHLTRDPYVEVYCDAQRPQEIVGVKILGWSQIRIHRQ